MSGEGPESVPTSADPRSKRPTKKRALTPVSEQAASVTALFAKPDQEIRIPAPGASKQRRAALPPEIVTNVQGSSAGAGSGEFHVYKASRRREIERLRIMDEEKKREDAEAEFESRKRELQARDEEKTRKNREKRDKRKKGKAAAAVAAKEAWKQVKGEDGKGGDQHRDDDDTAASATVPLVKVTGPGAGAKTGNAEPIGQDGGSVAALPSGLVIHDDD